MKKYLILTLLALPLFAWTQKAKRHVVYKPVKSFFLDLNNDGKIDTVSISVSTTEKAHEFNRITIKLAGFPKQTFNAKNGWSEIDHWLLDSNKNLVQSKQVFIKKTQIQTVIIVSGGTDDAGYGGEFSIINIEKNKIKMVFDNDGEDNNEDLDIEIPTTLTDLKKNGRLDFVYTDYREVYKKVKGGMIGTYVPYFVFPVTDSCKLDDSLTKAYNKTHYIWAESKFGKEIQIYYPDNKKLKPRIWHALKN